ncbi:MAG: YitT family protein [Ginsengibacter sp.]
MQYENVYSFIFDKLHNELPDYLYYHNASHTKDVINACIELAGRENVNGEDLTILKTAALFHDVGFIETYSGHEDISNKMARKWLPDFDYSPDQIDRIEKLISVTKSSAEPHDISEKIIRDADLYYLGTNRYEEISGKLYEELKEAGFVKDKEEWYTNQLRFLKAHKYNTESAKKILNAQVLSSLRDLKKNHIMEFEERKKIDYKTVFKDSFFILIGVTLSAFALKGFLVPNKFFDGGVTGISLLVHELYHFDLAYVILIVNFPFVVVSVFIVNWEYALKTFFCIILLGLFLVYIPYPIITSDKLLVAIFGGFFLGAGIGLIMRAGSALDGIEILALYTVRRSSFTISEIILGINIFIFLVAAISFGMEVALYSMLTYFTATKTIDYVVEGIEAYIGVTIISGKSEIIKDRLVNEMGRGITIYKGERGYLPGQFGLHADCDIIFTIITRLELRRLKNLIQEVDPNSFVFANIIKEAAGGIIKRRHIH